MNAKTMKPTSAQRVAKVKRVLKKFVPWDASKSLAVKKAIEVDGRHVILYLGRGEWTLAHHHTIDGVIGGFSANVTSVVSGLCSLGQFTSADEAEFEEWWRKKHHEIIRENGIQTAKELADRYGFYLSPKKKVKKTSGNKS